MPQVRLRSPWGHNCTQQLQLAAAMNAQDKDIISSIHAWNDQSQNDEEIHKRAEYTIPHLDGTYYTSDSSDIDSHEYLDLANIDNIQYNTRANKRKQKINEVQTVKIDLAD